MQNVADDGDFLTLQIAQFLAHREGVEQGLGGVFVGAITGVNDIGRDAGREVMRRARTAVAHHDHVHFHRQNVVDRVEQRFTLGDGASRSRKVHNIRRKALFGEFEGKAGAGGVLEENVGDGNVAQGGDFLDRAIDDFLKLGSGIENRVNIRFVQILDP